jgi:hypothetical protein
MPAHPVLGRRRLLRRELSAREAFLFQAANRFNRRFPKSAFLTIKMSS